MRSEGIRRFRCDGFGRLAVYLALFFEVGGVLLTTTLLGTLGGYWLDEQLGTIPILLLAGLLLGLIVGGLAVSRLVTRFLARFE